MRYFVRVEASSTGGHGKEKKMNKQTNRSALMVALARKGLSMAKISDEMNITPTTFSYKVNGKREFTQSEIKAIMRILDLSPEEIVTIFFGTNAESNSTEKQ
jgi:lambda repressor-like predicted transcriptional regulator